MLRASIPLPTDEKITDAMKDFIPYFKNYCERVSSEEEKTAWTESHVEKDVKGVVLEGEGWEDKREVEMLRVNPKFILRQWVLEELIGKLESTGTDRIEEGRRELARVLDVRYFCLSSSFFSSPHVLSFRVSLYDSVCHHPSWQPRSPLARVQDQP